MKGLVFAAIGNLFASLYNFFVCITGKSTNPRVSALMALISISFTIWILVLIFKMIHKNQKILKDI